MLFSRFSAPQFIAHFARAVASTLLLGLMAGSHASEPFPTEMPIGAPEVSEVRIPINLGSDEASELNLRNITIEIEDEDLEEFLEFYSTQMGPQDKVLIFDVFSGRTVSDDTNGRRGDLSRRVRKKLAPTVEKQPESFIDVLGESIFSQAVRKKFKDAYIAPTKERIRIAFSTANYGTSLSFITMILVKKSELSAFQLGFYLVSDYVFKFTQSAYGDFLDRFVSYIKKPFIKENEYKTALKFIRKFVVELIVNGSLRALLDGDPDIPAISTAPLSFVFDLLFYSTVTTTGSFMMYEGRANIERHVFMKQYKALAAKWGSAFNDPATLPNADLILVAREMKRLLSKRNNHGMVKMIDDLLPKNSLRNISPQNSDRLRRLLVEEVVNYMAEYEALDSKARIAHSVFRIMSAFKTVDFLGLIEGGPKRTIAGNVIFGFHRIPFSFTPKLPYFRMVTLSIYGALWAWMRYQPAQATDAFKKVEGFFDRANESGVKAVKAVRSLWGYVEAEEQTLEVKVPSGLDGCADAMTPDFGTEIIKMLKGTVREAAK